MFLHAFRNMHNVILWREPFRKSCFPPALQDRAVPLRGGQAGLSPSSGRLYSCLCLQTLKSFQVPPPPLQITVPCPSSNTRFRAVCVQNSEARGAFLGSAAVSPTFGPRRYYSRADAPVPHTAASRNSCPCSRPPTRAVPTPVHFHSLIFALVHSAPITRNVDVLKTVTACVRSSVLVFW